MISKGELASTRSLRALVAVGVLTEPLFYHGELIFYHDERSSI